MTDLPGPRGLSGLALVEGCYGTALVLFGGPLLRTLTGRSVDRRVINVARVLGTRQLLQGVVTIWRPTRRTLTFGAAVDTLHAATMVAGAAADVGPRRLTLASGATAGAFAAAALAQAAAGSNRISVDAVRRSPRLAFAGSCRSRRRASRSR